MVYIVPDQKTVPPSEKVKLQIIEAMEALHQMYAELEYYKGVNKYPVQVVSRFFAIVKMTYMMMRPKIIEFSQRNTVGKEIQDNYKEFIDMMDYYIDNSDEFELEYCIECYKYLIQFAEDYEITKTWFRQVSPSGVSVLGQI